MRFAIAGMLVGCLLGGPASAQENATSEAAQSRFYQSQVFSSQANSSMSGGGRQAATPGIPYYVDPSRFYYNRPGSVGNRGTASGGTSAQGPTYNIQVRPGIYYQGFYPLWRRGYGYGRYFGPQVYYPRVYRVAPGVTQHVGPFVPIFP